MPIPCCLATSKSAPLYSVPGLSVREIDPNGIGPRLFGNKQIITYLATRTRTKPPL